MYYKKQKNFIILILKDFINRDYKLISILIILRLSYIILFNNDTGDLLLYDKIANGLINGCGFGILLENGNCTSVVGHFFPAFFYLIAISYKIGIGIKGLACLISLFQLSSIIYLSKTIRKYTKQDNLAKFVMIIMAISPLTLGWNRLILIEPILTGFSILFLSEYIKTFYEGFTNKNFTNLIIIQIISIYLKPTAILFTLPLIVLGLKKLNILDLFKRLILWALIISLAVLPWGLRNISEGGRSPFTSVLQSNFLQKNSGGYIRWLSSWVITEHEQAINGFPVSCMPDEIARNITFSTCDLKIRKGKLNPFISSKEIEIAQKIVENKDLFTAQDNNFFEKETISRRKNLGFLGLFALYFSKIISLLLNPFNSWGWPIEIKANLLNYSKYNIISNIIKTVSNPEILIRATLKLFLFFYRLIFFYIFLRFTFKRFTLNRIFLFREYSLNQLLKISSFLFLMGTIYLIAIQYPSLEHRYISIVIPWLELSILISLNELSRLRFYPRRSF